MNSALSWSFLQEPIYRWFIFVVVMILFMTAWGDVLRFMKRAVD